MAGFTADDLQAQVPRLRRYARALTGTREAADDLTQDTLERAWHKRALWNDAATPTPSLRAWLYTVMHNVFVNSLRRVRPTESIDGLPEADTRWAAPSASAETGAALRDLQRALAQLPDEQREVVLLVGLEQLSYAEAAAALEVPIGTVMSRLSRGRERLRHLLDGAPDRAAGLRRIK
ncbi:MAG: RNA polymerase sigma factor [Burkholderiaceae bacterium]|jgi:RNA polymerase sigma-70 factor (ECF subfamily)|nr:RNA polymerase sigma factor [Burkholderiaceae bacterium]